MARMHYEHRHLDIACDLTGTGMAARVAEWRELCARSGLRAERVPGGGRLWLRRTAWSDAMDLSRREAECCGFLDFDLVAEGGHLYLEVTSAAAGGGDVAERLVGLVGREPFPQ